jgi:Xaa-Pro dipeptidase
MEATVAVPPADELEERLSRLQTSLNEEGLDWFVCFSPANVRWLTDFTHDVDERPFLLLVPVRGRPVMVAPLLERAHVLDQTRLPLEVAAYRELPAPPGETWADALLAVLPTDARIGADPSLPIGVFRRLPAQPLVGDLIEPLRAVKSPYEIARITYACDVLSDAHAVGVWRIRPGATNAEVSAAATGVMSNRLRDDAPDVNVLTLSTFMMVWPATLSADPHNLPRLHTPFVTGGPQVTIALLNAAGYAAELERTFFLGHVPEEARRPYAAMLEARETAFDLLRPGVVLGDVDRACRSVLTRSGYGDALLHRTGHGMGVQGHEPPFLAEADTTVAEPGMVFSIEPGVYLPGLGGFRHSDTVLVTEAGCRSLTTAPASLDELVLST